MKSYVQIVEKARKTNSSRILTNAAPSHANVLIKNLLIAARSAKEDVKIVTGEFSAEVYDETISNEVSATLDSGRSFDVIITDAFEADMAGNPVYDILEAARAADGNEERVKIQFAGEAFSKISHFVLVGENKYRLESDPTTISTIASFNDPNTGKLINGLFTQATSILDEGGTATG